MLDKCGREFIKKSLIHLFLSQEKKARARERKRKRKTVAEEKRKSFFDWTNRGMSGVLETEQKKRDVELATHIADLKAGGRAAEAAQALVEAEKTKEMAVFWKKPSVEEVVEVSECLAVVVVKDQVKEKKDYRMEFDVSNSVLEPQMSGERTISPDRVHPGPPRASVWRGLKEPPKKKEIPPWQRKGLAASFEEKKKAPPHEVIDVDGVCNSFTVLARGRGGDKKGKHVAETQNMVDFERRRSELTREGWKRPELPWWEEPESFVV